MKGHLPVPFPGDNSDPQLETQRRPAGRALWTYRLSCPLPLSPCLAWQLTCGPSTPPVGAGRPLGGHPAWPFVQDRRRGTCSWQDFHPASHQVRT